VICDDVAPVMAGMAHRRCERAHARPPGIGNRRVAASSLAAGLSNQNIWRRPLRRVSGVPTAPQRPWSREVIFFFTFCARGTGTYHQAGYGRSKKYTDAGGIRRRCRGISTWSTEATDGAV
jgi:hypothetical protein